ncbi:hypothetical protein KVR01_003101 [Diaporthe batatas]|uniref:uncharacterized protein n=1 Tax=Diaporthe batatas TaxID=748121 RepID=UPI001D036915|nr:uncharacterized protein KVR01_003101 [Diaporthe batatas]KAG8167412.1 hypothetical protein KVR01_003101 [Diaporthe batatas]
MQSNRSGRGSGKAADVSFENAQFLIPTRHTATSTWLLSLPAIQSVIGDYPRTYFHELEESTPLPRPLDLVNPEPISWPLFAPGLLQELADRLINRVHSSLYSPDSIDVTVLSETVPAAANPNLNRLVAISSELNRQLEQYYISIPITPPIMADPVSNDRRRILSLRTIIEKCHICIQSCDAFLRGAVDVLDKRSPYLWSISDGALACFIVLFLASQSPYLRHLTPDVTGLADVVVAKLRKWATPGSVFEAQVSIVDGLMSR